MAIQRLSPKVNSIIKPHVFVKLFCWGLISRVDRGGVEGLRKEIVERY